MKWHRWFPSHRPPSLSNRAGLRAFIAPPCKSPKFFVPKAICVCDELPPRRIAKQQGRPAAKVCGVAGADAGWLPGAPHGCQFHSGTARLETPESRSRVCHCGGRSLDTRGAFWDEIRPLPLGHFPGRLLGSLEQPDRMGFPLPGWAQGGPGTSVLRVGLDP